MDPLTNSERVLHGSLYCLTFVTGLVDAGSYVAMGHVFTANMTGNIVFLGFAFGGVPGLSIERSATALGFALLGGWLAGRLDSFLGKRRRNICFCWVPRRLSLRSVHWPNLPRGNAARGGTTRPTKLTFQRLDIQRIIGSFADLTLSQISDIRQKALSE